MSALPSSLGLNYFKPNANVLYTSYSHRLLSIPALNISAFVTQGLVDTHKNSLSNRLFYTLSRGLVDTASSYALYKKGFYSLPLDFVYGAMSKLAQYSPKFLAKVINDSVRLQRLGSAEGITLQDVTVMTAAPYALHLVWEVFFGFILGNEELNKIEKMPLSYDSISKTPLRFSDEDLNRLDQVESDLATPLMARLHAAEVVLNQAARKFTEATHENVEALTENVQKAAQEFERLSEYKVDDTALEEARKSLFKATQELTQAVQMYISAEAGDKDAALIKQQEALENMKGAEAAYRAASETFKQEAAEKCGPESQRLQEIVDELNEERDKVNNVAFLGFFLSFSQRAIGAIRFQYLGEIAVSTLFQVSAMNESLENLVAKPLCYFANRFKLLPELRGNARFVTICALSRFVSLAVFSFGILPRFAPELKKLILVSGAAHIAVDLIGGYYLNHYTKAQLEGTKYAEHYLSDNELDVMTGFAPEPTTA